MKTAYIARSIIPSQAANSIHVMKISEEFAKLCEEFESFYNVLTERVDGFCRMKEEALPQRLQNISSMISLLADFYELTGNKKYLEDANDFADYLMSLQSQDGSYRNENVHYTCVIYPAKSMLELAIVEKEAGFGENDKINETYSDFIKEKFGVSNNTKWKKSNTFKIGDIVRFRDGSIGKVDDITYPYGSDIMEIQAKTFDEDAESEDDYAYVSNKFSDFEKIDNDSKTTNDKAIPDEQDKPETAGDVKAEKEDKTMDEVKTKALADDKCAKDEESKEEKTFAEGVDYGEEKEKKEPKKLDSEHESEGAKKADEKKKDEKEAEDKCTKDSALTMDIDTIKAQVRAEMVEDFKAREEARKSVEPIIGDVNVMAFDSCNDIYKLACEKEGLPVNEIVSYKDALTGYMAGKAKLAEDASPVSGSNEECFKDIRV